MCFYPVWNSSLCGVCVQQRNTSQLKCCFFVFNYILVFFPGFSPTYLHMCLWREHSIGWWSELECLKINQNFVMKHVLKEPSCYRDFYKDAVLHLSLLKIKVFLPGAKRGFSYPSFGACSMSSGWTSHYKTILLILSLHKANPLNFTACGLCLRFHSWELKVPKLLPHGSGALRELSYSHHQSTKHSLPPFQKLPQIWFQGSSFPLSQISCTDPHPLRGTCMNISVRSQFLCHS